MTEKVDLKLKINGRDHAIRVEPRKTLVDAIREDCGQTGTHIGCEHGICGACSVMLDGEPVRSCLMFAVQADGHKVTTVEGLTNADGTPGILQDSFCEKHALQCGYCTSGMLIAAHALLQTVKRPTDEQIREAIGGNLCRCTGYQQIVDAVKHAAARLGEKGR